MSGKVIKSNNQSPSSQSSDEIENDEKKTKPSTKKSPGTALYENTSLLLPTPPSKLDQSSASDDPPSLEIHGDWMYPDSKYEEIRSPADDDDKSLRLMNELNTEYEQLFPEKRKTKKSISGQRSTVPNFFRLCCCCRSYRMCCHCCCCCCHCPCKQRLCCHDKSQTMNDE